MKALILAGGFGTRLKTVVPTLPKPLADVSGRPFLEYLLDQWIENGVSEFYLLVCHLAEKIKAHFKNEYRGCKIQYIQEKEPLQTGGAVLYALNHFSDLESDVVIMNGDTFLDVDFKEMQLFHQKNNSDMTMALRKVEKNDRYSGAVLSSDFKIKTFAKREPNSPHLLINAGLYFLKPKVMFNEGYKSGDVFSIEDDFFPKMIQNKSAYGFLTHGKFIDIGIPVDYQRAQTFFSYAK